MALFRSREMVSGVIFTGTPENIAQIVEMLDGKGDVSTTQVQIFEEEDLDLKGPIGSLVIRDTSGFVDLYRPEEIAGFHTAYEEITL